MSAISTILLQLNRGVWAIEPNSINAFFPVVSSLLKGEKQDFSVLFTQNNLSNPLQVINIDNATYTHSYYDSINTAPKNSIAVLNVTGAIMKYDYCGSPGTTTMASWLKEADANPNISSHVLIIDSPGGAADGTLNFAETIKSLNKPVRAFVNGMCCSAAYWIASACKEIYASNTLDIIGSIGTFSTIVDYREQLAAEGIKVHEIYASASTEKNRPIREALDGEYQLLRSKMIDPFNEAFTSSIKKNRGMKENFNAEKVLNGDTFLSKEAQKYGLIDGIKTLEQLLIQINK